MKWDCTIVKSNNVDGTVDYCVVAESDWIRDKEMAEKLLKQIKEVLP